MKYTLKVFCKNVKLMYAIHIKGDLQECQVDVHIKGRAQQT